RRDLDTVRRVLRVRCPVVALVCDLERAPGLREFLQRFPAAERRRRFGQRFPLARAAHGTEVQKMIEKGVSWICDRLLADWVYYRLFRLEDAARQDPWPLARENARLFQLLAEVRERRGRLAQVLTRGIAVEESGPQLCGGCYLTG